MEIALTANKTLRHLTPLIIPVFNNAHLILTMTRLTHKQISVFNATKPVNRVLNQVLVNVRHAKHHLYLIQGNA